MAIAAAFFAYVLLIRTYAIADTFLMLGEQIRDWTIALGPWSDLPLTGAPSTAGGRGLGPVYYWVLWFGRQVIGPFTGNLPHAGGITVALLQSAADTCLLVALWRRIPLPLALGMMLLLASAPFDVSISGVIWNPPVSAAFVKLATAAALSLGNTPAAWQVAGTTALAWLGVQAHASAIFVAAPLIGALAAQPIVLRIAGAAAPARPLWIIVTHRAAIIVAVVLALQVPYVVSQLRSPEAALGPAAVLTSMRNAPSIDIAKSYSAMVNTTGELLVRQGDRWTFEWPFLLAAVVVGLHWRRDGLLLAVSVAPILAGTLLFATWTRPYDSYWFLTMMPAMVLTFGMLAMTVPSPAAVRWIGVAVLAAAVVVQPSRIEQSKAFFRYPEYRAMRLASRELARQAPVLRDIRITFTVHPTMDKYFMYTILGGRIDRGAARTAYVESDGRVRIE
jgi:hypothetical protein